MPDLLVDLAAPFDGYYTAKGVPAPFLSGEQVATRLNKVVGVGRWNYRVLERWHDAESDEVVVLGELSLYVEEQWITRQQFGSQKVKRFAQGPSIGRPLNVGDDYKGASTDAMKKCASLFGVGLYMMVSSAEWHPGVPPRQMAAAAAQQPSRPQAAPARPAQAPDAPQAAPERPAAPDRPRTITVDQIALALGVENVPGEHINKLRTGPYPPEKWNEGGTGKVPCCQACGDELKPVTVGGMKWTVAKLRYQANRTHGMQLCSVDWHAANALRKQGQEAATG